MKLNWGTGIAISLALFACLMGFMVYLAMQQDFDLVSEDYYSEEIAYQEIIDQKQNTLRLEGKASLQLNEEGVFLQLPADLEGKTKSFEGLMYHEQEADNDFSFGEEHTEENRFEIPFTQFAQGKWIAKIKVHCEGVDYYFDPQINL